MDQEFHDKMSFRSWQQTMCWLQPMPHLSYAHGHNLTTSWLSIDDLVKETIPYSCQSSPSLSGQLCANCKIFSLPSTFVKNQRLVCLHAKRDSSSSLADADHSNFGTCSLAIFILIDNSKYLHDIEETHCKIKFTIIMYNAAL